MVALYSNIRTTIVSGDLIAWKMTRLSSLTSILLFLYQKIIRANYTHVGIATVLGGRVFITEATPPCVRIFPLSMLDSFYLVKTNIDDKPEHLDNLFRELGKPYSLIEFLKTIFRIKTGDYNYYCSYLVSKFYNDIGYITREDAGLTPDTIVSEIERVSNFPAIFVKIDKGNLTNI